MFTVVIPSKTASNLLPCLEAVRACEPTCPIVIIDDGVGDQGLDQAAFFEPISAIPGRKPFVFARNCNLGIRDAMEAGHDGVVLCNDDCLLESPGGFSLLDQCCKTDPTIGLIGATTNLTGQPLQIRQAQEDVLGCRDGSEGPMALWPVSNRAFGLRVVPHIAFVAVYIPRTSIETIGMLDEDFNQDYGCEDRWMCEQCARARLKVCVHDACFVDHAKLKSSFRGAPEAPRSFAKNYAVLMQKAGGTLITE